MAVNKVKLSDNTTLIDLTNDTVTANTLHSGFTAHGKDGEIILGSYVPPVISDKIGKIIPSTDDIPVYPDDGSDGMSKVTVSGDPNLIPDNILGGVSIFGVEGNTDVMNTRFPSSMYPSAKAAGSANIYNNLYAVSNGKYRRGTMFSHFNHGDYINTTRQAVSNLSIDLGFTPIVFVMRLSGITATNTSTYDMCFGFAFAIGSLVSNGSGFVYKTNRGSSSLGNDGNAQGPKIRSNGVSGNGSAVMLAVGKYEYYAWG